MKRGFDDVLLGSIELFCLAAEMQSFTAAAQVAGITPAAVSRSISRMEERMGLRLFARTTRSVRLTEQGNAYFVQCRQALNQLLEAQREAMGKQSIPSGTLRISVPTTYGHHRILPVLPEFRARFPEIRIDVHISNRNIDFVAEGYDLAIRVRALPDSGMTSRLLEDAQLVTFASADYLQRCGIPETPQDLLNHDCIQFELPSNGRRIPWLYKSDGRDLELQTRGGLNCAADVLGGVTLAKHGGGIFQTYRFIVENELREGSLIELLKPHSGTSRPFSALFQNNRHVPLRLRVFLDFLIECRARWSSDA